MGKLLLLTLNEQEETAIDKIISAISDYIQIEPMQITTASVLSFPGLEIKQNQRQVFQDGEEVSLTRLEYSTLVYLASNPGIVLTRTQIFEAVWNMESESCQSSVANVIYNLRKKIEPDSRKPIYIKTVLGMGYKFASGEWQQNNRRPLQRHTMTGNQKRFPVFLRQKPRWFSSFVEKFYQKVFQNFAIFAFLCVVRSKGGVSPFS